MLSLPRLLLAALTLLGVSHGAAALSPLEKRAIDSALLTRFQLMAHYSAAAYCVNNHNSPGDALTCEKDKCPLVEKANASTVVEFTSTTSTTGVTGYLAIDPTNNLIVLTFRGSSTLNNWLTNMDFALIRTKLCSSCTVHRGFYQSWLDARDALLDVLKATSAQYPHYKIVVTGHSLGGAIATLAAAQLRNDGYAVALYTLGAPRVGDAKLSKYISEQPGGNYRITHYNDPVPRMPPVLLGFVHVTPEYYIAKPNGKEVKKGDVKIVGGSINYLSGNGAFLETDVQAHLWYFGETGCAAKKGAKRDAEEEEEQPAAALQAEMDVMHYFQDGSDGLSV
ncbi:Alpha/Beta hydrolase protein [Massariosphaeria phaeospora]|uniref:Alpha/Beta hydrolase protein n=1 Tax=Massariosphaeria phaeospora TaxID=100035 RepID=A0A7C8M4W7_9PLEO|nr:Alpha/Beta hydrolase protein [Massariosphaeria phaeospora]